MSKFKCIVFTAVAAIGCISFGDIYTWSGASSTAFSTAGNWLVGGVAATAAPGASDEVIIDAAEIANKPSITAETAVGKLSILSGKLTLSAPLSVNGDFSIADGARLEGAPLDIFVYGDFDFAEGAVVSVSTSGGVSTGAPKTDYESGASHGGRGSRNVSLPTATKAAEMYAAGEIAPCYGNVREPWETGSSWYGQGGGKGRFTVTGATHFNGKMYATGGGADSRCASGGSLILTTGTIDGAGYMQVKGGKTNGRWSMGGAGRIAVTLTAEDATFENFTGNFGAYGTDATVSTSDSSQNEVLPHPSRRTVAGAGTVYLRAGGEAIDEGAMIVDNCRDDWATAGKVDWEQSVTELNVTMPDRVFGKVIVRRGAKLELMPGVDVETSVWSNGSRVVCAPTSTVKIKGDRNGDAWIWGSTDFGSLVILPSVKTLHVEAGSVQKVVTKFAANGAAVDDKTAICSTEDGVAFSLDVAADALQDLSYLSLKDCAAVGATLSSQFSSAVSGVTGWTFTEIPVGQQITWLGGASSVWGEAANWQDADGANRTPLGTDAIVIPAGAEHQPKLPATAMSLYSLSVASGATLFVNGSALTVQGLASVHGTLAVNADETIVFAGGADLSGATFTPVESTVKVANASAATYDFGGLTFNRLVFANAAAATVSGGFKATELTAEAGSGIRFAQDVAVTATKLVAPGTAAQPISLNPAVEGGTYVFTLTADATISHLTVAGADSSAGMTVYALDGSEATDGNVVNWKFADTRFVWTGASSTTFSAAGNWFVAGEVPDTAPGADDDVVIDAADLSRKPTVTANLSVGSILLKSGTLTFNNTVEGTVARSFVLQDGATLTIGRPLVVGGSLLMENGSKLNGIGGTDYYIDVTVGGDFDFREGATVSAGQGGVTTGKPRVDKESGASHGGRGSRNYDLPSAATMAQAYQDGEIVACYGNVREPWEYGSNGARGEAGGGKARFTVTGATHFNGKMYATGGGGDSRCASGGSLILTTGTIDGKGYMQVKGGKTNGRRGLGGAGRIAVTLTELGATFGNFAGNFGAYGADGTVSTSDSSQNEVLPKTSRRTVSGAGTVYLRAGGEAIDEGAAIIDNCRDDWATAGKVDWEMSITEFNTTMPDLDFGKVIVRRGGKLVLMPGVEVETSVWSNGCRVVCDPTSTVKIKGDRNGEAWIFGDTTFGNLTILPSVTTLHVEAGSVQTVVTKLTAKGVSADELMLFRSTAPGTSYSLDVSADAATDLEFLGVADALSIGAKLAPQRSRDDGGNNEEGWDFTTIDPGMVITWNGSASSAWGLADNWTDANGTVRAPIATDRVAVPAGTPNAPVMPVATVTVMDLTVAAGATLNLNGATLVVTGDIAVSGRMVATASEALTFGGNVVFADGSFAAADSTVTLAPAAAATANFGGCEFNRFVFAAADATLVTGGFTATELAFDAGAEAAFAQGVAVTATKLNIAGTAQDNVVLGPQTDGGTWKLTVKGYSTVGGVTVGGADSSEGMAIYASEATFSDGNNINWNLGDSRYHWTGAVDADFAKPGNWLVGEDVPETAPGEDDEIVVDSVAQTMTVSSEGVKVKGLTLTAGAVKFSTGVEIAGAMVMLGGTSATIDAPTKIDGSFLMFDGSTLTHSAQGGGALKYWIELDVGGDAVFESGSKIKLDANGYANETGPGNGKASTSGASYGGQGGYTFATAPDPVRAVCYGSIFSVTNCGSGGRYYGAIGGGLFILHADTGTVTFDGTVDASPKYVDNCASSGGGVWITAGRFRGAGEINCDGGQNNNATAGGGGRISVILREPGATFEGCNVNMHAFGGWYGNGNSGNRAGGAGTIYLQTGDELDGHGVIRMVNHPSVGYITYTLLGYDGCDDLRHARLEIGRNVRVGVLTQSTDGAPLKIADFTLADATAKLDLCGNVLKVGARWRAYATAQVVNAGELVDGKKPNWSNILWQMPGTIVVVR